MKYNFPATDREQYCYLNVVCADVWDMEEVGQVGQVMVGVSDAVHVLQMASLLPVPPQLDTQG